MIYLHEVIECLPNKTDAYLDFVERVYLPMADTMDLSWLVPCGLWKPRTTYGKWSQAVLLYRIPSWEKWLNYMAARSQADNERFHKEFYTPALGLRSGWFDKVLVSLPFSPEPPVRPEVVRTGAMFLDHQIRVRPDGIREFVAAVRDVVVPAAAEQGLRLELFARTLARPTEFQALWSLSDKQALVRWRECYDVEALAPNLPSFEAAWPYVTDFEERDLIPTFTSPLGGQGAYVGERGGVADAGALTSLPSSDP